MNDTYESGEQLDNNTCTPFIRKLVEFIEEPSTNHIVSWSPNGKSFVVWDPGQFSTVILPNYFKHGNLSSFVRQLNQYGFHKCSQKRYEFSHELFQRDQPELWVGIQRNRPVGVVKDKRFVKSPNLICYNPVFGLPFVPEEYLLSDLGEILYRKNESLKETVARQQEENEILKKRLREYEAELVSLQAQFISKFGSMVVSRNQRGENFARGRYDEDEENETTAPNENLQTIENIKTTLGCFQSEEDSFDESSKRDFQSFGTARKSNFAYLLSQNLDEEDSVKFSSSGNFHKLRVSGHNVSEGYALGEQQGNMNMDNPSAEFSYPRAFPFQESFNQDSSSLKNLMESLHQETKAVLGKHERFESGSSSMLYFPKLLRTDEHHEVVSDSLPEVVTDNNAILSSHNEYGQLNTEISNSFDFPRDSEENSQGKIISSQDWPLLEKSMDELSANLSSMSFSATLAATMQQIEDEQYHEKEKTTFQE
ncbi:Heat stress transcription factor A-1a [Galdieria sulphuraria]|nr:Heat stress transcription factor A-1a [Galdieria sulphuraria]